MSPDLLPEEMALDIESSLISALDGGTVFSETQEPLAIFQHALSVSLRDIEAHPRGRLVRKFLEIGPYDKAGDIPRGVAMSDDEAASAIAFVGSYMVPSFQGALAELLAAGPCLQLMNDLRQLGRLPAECRLFAGDAVQASVPGRRGLFKAADFHMLAEGPGNGNVTVAAVGEVKSYRRSSRRLGSQLERHARRVAGGFKAGGVEYHAEQVRLGAGSSVLGIQIVPDQWTLPRTFFFEEREGKSFLIVTTPSPPVGKDLVEPLNPETWRITLRWSHEALAAAALDLSYWYMEKVGEAAFVDHLPEGWNGMSPAEAGRNAAKMMLYYAILRARNRQEESRAIALYNSYSFGYALGMSFRDPRGRRQMLWLQDLKEILANGRNKKGWRLAEPRRHRQTLPIR